jgi:hypothetical protein
MTIPESERSASHPAQPSKAALAEQIGNVLTDDLLKMGMATIRIAFRGKRYKAAS